MPQKTCVLGLGLMGRRAVMRLSERGHDVVAWNRTPLSPKDELAGIATLASSVVEAVRDASTILIFLHNSDAVFEVLLNSGALKYLPPNCFIADMGTNTPEAAQYLALQLPGNVHFVDAPVSGGTSGVEQGTLSIFLGARNQDVTLAQTALKDLGRVSHMGDVGAGQAAKLANQIVVACTIAGLVEGIAYGEAFGLKAPNLVEAMRGGLAESRILKTIGARICAEDFSPHGRATTHLKDLDYAFSQIASGSENLPVARAAQKHLLDLVRDFGDLDHGAMVLVVRAALSGATDFSSLESSAKPDLKKTQI